MSKAKRETFIGTLEIEVTFRSQLWIETGGHISMFNNNFLLEQQVGPLPNMYDFKKHFRHTYG